MVASTHSTEQADAAVPGLRKFSRDDKEWVKLSCDPFGTIKETECLQKCQLLRLDALLQSYQMTLQWQQRLAPMQKKILDFMKREMDGIDDADQWKQQSEG